MNRLSLLRPPCSPPFTHQTTDAIMREESSSQTHTGTSQEIRPQSSLSPSKRRGTGGGENTVVSHLIQRVLCCRSVPLSLNDSLSLPFTPLWPRRGRGGRWNRLLPLFCAVSGFFRPNTRNQCFETRICVCVCVCVCVTLSFSLTIRLPAF